MGPQNILLKGFEVSSAELSPAHPMEAVWDPALPSRLLSVPQPCNGSWAVQFALWSHKAVCRGKVLLQLFLGRLYVQALRSSLVFSLPNQCKSCLYWIWGIFSQKEVGAEWNLPGLVVWECCLSWAHVVSDCRDRLLQVSPLLQVTPAISWEPV